MEATKTCGFLRKEFFICLYRCTLLVDSLHGMCITGKTLLGAHTCYKDPWTDLKSYAGLVLDGFLLPQIMFNLFLNSSEKALAPSFYAGTTVIRLLPHAYDLYRAHSSTWYLDLSYLYANHTYDFYSTAWDIIIPLCGLLFAILIYLQQQFGGRCFLPKRFRGGPAYEKVPIVSNEELQEITTH